MPKGPRTVATLRNNVVVGVQYLEAWLGGLGCVPLYNLMEDAATAEICRTQVICLLVLLNLLQHQGWCGNPLRCPRSFALKLCNNALEV